MFTRAQEHDPPSKDDLAGAEQEFRAALGADSGLHVARFNLGTTLLKQGKDEAGVSELKAYLAAAPNGESAKPAARMIEEPRRAREDFAPDFSIVTTEGEHLDLDALKGKVVVIDFWASWCAPCKDSIPLLKMVRKRFPEDRVAMISISVDQDAAAWRAALQRERMPWAQCLDAGGRVGRAFDIRPIPSTFVLDGEGIIRKRIVGYSPQFGHDLEAAVQKALKQAP